MVFEWNANGTEFIELNFGDTGTGDGFGVAAGDSRTGGHHIITIAEEMARGLSPAFVITQASAHSAPTSGNECKVVNVERGQPNGRSFLVPIHKAPGCSLRSGAAKTGAEKH